MRGSAGKGTIRSEVGMEGEMNKAKALQGTWLIAVGTFATRILGFAREILAAAFFGTGALYDAFLVAFAVPNLFRRVLGEEMFERAFLPPFRRMIAEGREAEARAFLGKIFLFVCACLAVVTTVIFFWLPEIVHLLAPGLESSVAQEALTLARWMLPFLFLIGLASLEGAVLLFSDRKLLFAAAPAFTNATIIVVLVVLHDRLSIMAMVVAWLAGIAAAILVQAPAVFRIFARLTKPNETDPKPPVTPAIREGGNILVSSITTKAVEIVDRAVASMIGAGAISSLYFGFRIIHLPFSIISLALSRSLAPEFSKLRGKKDQAGIARLLSFGLETNVLLMAPIIAFMMLFAKDIVSILYGYGKFDATSIDQTTLAFFYYALAILPMGFIALLNRVYASLEDNRLPVIAAILGGFTNITLDLLLYQTPLKQGGIALASAIGLSFQALLMLMSLGKFKISFDIRRLIYTTIRSLIGIAVMVLVVFALASVFPSSENTVSRLLKLGIAFAVSMSAYTFAALVMWPRPHPGKMRIVLTGGGTGGHVYPALAIHDMLKDQNLISETLFLGVRGRAEEVIVPRHGLKLRYISSAPYAGGSPIARFRTLMVVSKGVIESLIRIARFRPHLIVATGGYVSAPVIIAAFLLKPFLRLRIVIEEQNLVPGLLNKVASLLADVVLVSFRESGYFIWSNRCVYAGYPVRKAYLEAATDRDAIKRELGIPEDCFLILASGGSLGSRSINRVIAASLEQLKKKIPSLYVVHGVGMAHSAEYNAVDDTANRLDKTFDKTYDRPTMRVTNSNGDVFYEGHEYLHDIVRYQRAADLVVSRAGAGSLAEILCLGKAAIVIPKRGLPGDHQELNAIGIAQKDAIEVVFESRDPATGTDIVDTNIFTTMAASLAHDPPRLECLEIRAASLAFKDTQARIIAAIKAVLDGDEPDLIPAIIEPPFVRFHRQFDNLIHYLDDSSYDSMYRRLYEIKIHEYLASPNYLVVNKAIKLIGALQRVDLYSVFYRDFDRYKGFQRRNCLEALSKAPNFEDQFVDLIEKGLNDSYYEVRREAIKLYSCFHSRISQLARAKSFQKRIVGIITKRFESFEVKAAAIRASVKFLDEDDFIILVSPFLSARNVRLREAILNAVEYGLSSETFTDRTKLRRFIKGMLITTSQFRPEFTVRERFVRVVSKLEQ